MPDFNTVLDKKVGAVEKPKLLPPGHYIALNYKIADKEKSPDGKWEFLTFPMRMVQAMEDVDQEALTAFGGCGTHANNSRKFLFPTGDSTEDQASFDRGMYDLRRFLEDHLKCATPEMSLKEAINNALNQQCMVEVKWTADKKDPEVMHANITRTAPVEA